MAIEYFVTDRRTPHQRGRPSTPQQRALVDRGRRTSQFAQHLRCVSGQSARAVDQTSSYAVMVNVVGALAPGSLDAAKPRRGTFVHDYGKSWRPGRKLGHVTALGDEPRGPHVRAWESARAYGTVTREA
jgi:phosphoribosylaminoimidazole carboxylase (NCAIR synthetase)